MPRKHTDSATVPTNMQATFDTVVRLTDTFCQQHLNAEYAALCRERPSPLTSGDPASWAAGIVSVLGRPNFLDDPSQQPHMKIGDIGPKFGVGASTAAAKAKKIRALIRSCPPNVVGLIP